MLDFVCPSCQARCQVTDAYGGKSVVCPRCATTATVPMRDDAASAVTTPDIADATRQLKSHRRDDEIERDTFSIAKDGGALMSWVRGAIFLFLGLTVVLVILGLLIPATGHVQISAARVQSVNNVKQIVLAMHNFHDANNKLPFNGTRNAVAKDSTSGSWAFQILPYIDQGPMFANPQANLQTSVAVFMCPGRGRWTEVKTGPIADYFLNIYVNTKTIGNGWNAADGNAKLKDINAADGWSNTIFVGHGWISPNDYSKTVIPGQSNSIFLGGISDLARGGMDVQAVGTGPNAVMQRDSDALPAGAALIPWGGPFKQGALMGMGDGTVRMFPYSMSGTTFGAFLTPSNAEAVELPD